MKRFLFFTILILILSSPLIVHVVRALEIPHSDFNNANIQGADKSSYNYTNDQVQLTGHSLITAFIGGVSSNGEVVSQGAAPVGIGLIAQMVSDPPIKSSEYFADVGRNLGFAQPVYAQGIGFSALAPTLTIWKAFRNIAYFLFIVIFVVVGFMIMFRAQINPQTVVTIQAALPKMILSLALVTFSYAIAGFVIDLMYLVLLLVTSLFKTFGVISDVGIVRDYLFNRSIVKMGFDFLVWPNGAAKDFSDSVGNLFSSAILPGVPVIPNIASFIAYLIIAVAIVIAIFRTLFSLIMCWISIILSVIFAPIQLLINALPSVDTFGPWLKGLVANALVFPAVGIMVIIAVALAGSGQRMGVNAINGTSVTGGTGWVPPLVTSNSATTGTNNIQAIIGLGMVLLLPEVVKLVKGALGAEDKAGLGEAAFAGFQRGVAPVSNVVGAPGKVIGGIGRTVVGGLTTSVIQGAGGAIWQNAIYPKINGILEKRKQDKQVEVTPKTLHPAMKMHRTQLPPMSSSPNKPDPIDQNDPKLN